MTQKGSKSSDILDAASNNSPLGRTTDLDQAMKQRDEEKYESNIFCFYIMN
jgi:hypothetical protein